MTIHSLKPRCERVNFAILHHAAHQILRKTQQFKHYKSFHTNVYIFFLPLEMVVFKYEHEQNMNNSEMKRLATAQSHT